MLGSAISKLNIPSSSSKIKINGDDLAFIMTQTGGRPEFLYQPDFRYKLLKVINGENQNFLDQKMHRENHIKMKKLVK